MKTLIIHPAIDITERKKVELQSLKNEERMRILADTMYNVVYRLSPDWSEMIELEGKGFLANTVKPDKKLSPPSRRAKGHLYCGIGRHGAD